MSLNMRPIAETVSLCSIWLGRKEDCIQHIIYCLHTREVWKVTVINLFFTDHK
jgi:hypothetical protein